MSYDVVKKQLGHEPVYIVELEIDYCSNTFGVAPCQAASAPGLECFNTFQTCLDKGNFDATNLGPNPTDPITKRKYRFASSRVASAMQEAGDPVVFPTLMSIETTPTRLEPNRGFGMRSTCVVKLKDSPWTDVSIDPYVSTRNYVPDDNGTFWGKWLARNPFYESRRINVYTGYLDENDQFDISNFIKRSYILHKIDGPSPSGDVSITAKDPLKLADEERVQFPSAPTTKITQDMSVSSGSGEAVTVDDPQGQMAAWFADGQEYVRIDNEIMKVVSFVPIPGTMYVDRAIMPSFYEQNTNIPADHRSGASVQLCHLFEDTPIQDIIKYLLVDVSGIASEFVDPLNEWDAIIATTGYTSYSLSALLTQPSGVRKYMDELNKHNVYNWWDEREQVVRLATLTFSAVLPTALTEEENILADTIDVGRAVGNRLTQAWLMYGHRNPTFKMDEDVFFSTWSVFGDIEAESKFEGDGARISKVRSRWVTAGQTPIGNEIANRTLIDNRDTKLRVSLGLDPKDDDYWTGDSVGLNTRQVQNEFGQFRELNYIILEAAETLGQSGVSYRYLLEGRTTFKRTGVITPNDDPTSGPQGLVFNGEGIVFDGEDVAHSLTPLAPFPNYSDADSELRSHYAFIAYDEPFGVGSEPGFSDGTPAYQITI